MPFLPVFYNSVVCQAQLKLLVLTNVITITRCRLWYRFAGKSLLLKKIVVPHCRVLLLMLQVDKLLGSGPVLRVEERKEPQLQFYISRAMSYIKRQKKNDIYKYYEYGGKMMSKSVKPTTG
jgi:hypothetical protein